jgi:RNA polymerase sigma factor (sigma-70 family)
MSAPDLLPNLFKTEYSKMIAVLCSVLGSGEIQTAEDIVQDTFVAAAQTWGINGTPVNPAAWLYRVAKNKTVDYSRRRTLFNQHIQPTIKAATIIIDEADIDLSSENIADSQLSMMFVICHPAIPVESQLALGLKILCGFGVAQIASAFFITEENAQKRIYRAKEKLRSENIRIELPDPSILPKRLDNVLLMLYLLFNEGYYSATAKASIQKELCLEATRLCYSLLANHNTTNGSVYALLSLMCFHASRLPARMQDNPADLLYDRQDKTLWDDELIEKGNEFLTQAMKDNIITKYHLEACIAYWHSSKIPHPDKWKHIYALYMQLEKIDTSPLVTISKIYALAKCEGKENAINIALHIPLQDHAIYHLLLAQLYASTDKTQAIKYYTMAAQLTRSEQERNWITGIIQQLQ